MKNYVISLMAILFICGACSQNTVDFESEKAAIFETFKAEKEGFKTNDIDLMKQNIVTDSSYIFIRVETGNTAISRGWPDQEKAIISFWDNTDDSEVEVNHDFEITDIKIYPNSAWVLITNKWKYIVDEPARNGIDLESLFMEKIDGKWKISSHEVITTDLTIYSIGLVGTSLPGGWYLSSDLKKSEEMQGVWEGIFDLDQGEVKFRANNEWYINWGGDEFPSGDMVPDGQNIKVPKGKYQVTINLETKEYSFKKVQ
jgi:hypothetical protein